MFTATGWLSRGRSHRSLGVSVQRLLLSAASGAAVTLTSAVVLAQTAPAVVSAAPARATTGVPSRDTLLRMMRPVTVEFADQRLEDVMKYIQTVTSADLEVMWIEGSQASGLEKDKQINLKVQNITALALVEKILERAVEGAGAQNAATWQMSDSGAMQIGPKERLNTFRRLEVYPVMDLLFNVPNFTNAPEFDLQQVLQSRQGGGGGQSPFTGGQGQGQNSLATRPLEERADELKRLITGLVEPEQWQDNGGSGGTITWYQGAFMVSAPDYMHRQLAGYPYWPATATRIAQANGRRYVTLNADASVARLGKIINVPVSAVVGGQIISSDPNRNPPGGGSKAPSNPAPANTTPANPGKK
jgi:hypothetical protein